MLARVPDTEANDQLKRERAERRARHEEFEIRKQLEEVQRSFFKNFMERCNDFDRKKQERWQERLETDAASINEGADSSITQDLVLMATGIPGAEMKSLGEVALKFGDVYRDITKGSEELHKAFRDEVDTLHKTLIEIEAIREQYRNHKGEIKLMVANLTATRTQAELVATMTKIESLKQSSKEAEEEAKRYVNQSLKSFQSLLRNIEHFDRTDVYQRLSEKERNTYKDLAANLRENASGLSKRVDEYLSASAAGSFEDRDKGKVPKEDSDGKV
uniref:Uncharacterized protein n=1 Tax=Candidatus Kentrum eta TaxID=2126337 RepID=A0A450UWU3_9GAMM|nr:MAG: hypothetical protein BECKH772A_GA0070896_101009 [Candidatus Kentron sp. H]VFJ96992.1 MAG: hypothetical protein BECKH772B_GA0070898_101029 [Candidatus Kentron sp. H]VFK02663.1 MAG: hypothetical protein BECKH772C_GA0070978_100989 [Candidatus Kentron sp. H]